ncbi:UNVERIFIED_CONTAM: hypothetical protein GTU68_031038 [Idotea baltica]|nr:hypothetical protein [Idotea baltica]
MEKENLDFNTDVIERSQDVPILVDFWSPTCGPCLFLGPVLDKLATEAEGKWELIKVNTMIDQQIAMQYQITSIPAVKLFHKGKIINEFVGALPEGVLRKWLDEFLPDDRKDALNAILETVQSDRVAGLAQLRSFVADTPDLHIAKLHLAGEVLHVDPAEALALAASIPSDHLLFENGKNIQVLAEILTFDQEGEAPVIEKLAAAREAFAVQDYESSVKILIEAVELDKNAFDELPRRGTIALFRLFGMQHPLTKQYRRQFEMALS